MHFFLFPTAHRGLRHARCLYPRVQITGAENNSTQWVTAKELVNCAGLHSWDLAQAVEGYDQASLPPRHYARGSYYYLKGFGHQFTHLVYPMAEQGGLGVHLTIDLAGRLAVLRSQGGHHSKRVVCFSSAVCMGITVIDCHNDNYYLLLLSIIFSG